MLRDMLLKSITLHFFVLGWGGQRGQEERLSGALRAQSLVKNGTWSAETRVTMLGAKVTHKVVFFSELGRLIAGQAEPITQVGVMLLHMDHHSSRVGYIFSG